MTPREFSILADLAKRQAGIVFTPDKAYLVEGRINLLLRARSMGSIAELVGALGRGDRPIAAAVVDALTNNETSFFRDKAPFALLRDQVLPALADRTPGARITLWSAACSTGQEAYSLAMVMDRAARARPGLSFDILGTDISETCLKVAREGRYTEFEIQRGLSAADRTVYFERDGKDWRVRADMREKVRWRCLNLLQSLDDIGRVDIVFCRNVLIYFDQETRRHVLQKIASVLTAEGRLFLGASETVFGFADVFTRVPGAPGVYKPCSPVRPSGVEQRRPVCAPS